MLAGVLALSMTVGPLDRRKTASRCTSCKSAHLKVGSGRQRAEAHADEGLQCSGTTPCENCLRRQRRCEFPSRDLTIKIDAASISKLHRRSSETTRTDCSLVISPALDTQRQYVSAFFQVFIPQNNFTGKPSSFGVLLEGRLALDESLLSIVSAIGALQTSNTYKPRFEQRSVDAFHHYKAAVTSLRTQLNQDGGQRWLELMWTTFLLGLFELRALLAGLMNSFVVDGELAHLR